MVVVEKDSARSTERQKAAVGREDRLGYWLGSPLLSVRTIVNCLVLSFALFWIYNEVRFSVSCSNPILCRSLNAYGAHSIVWIIIAFVAVYGSVYDGFNGVLGGLLAVWMAGLHELFWNSTAMLLFSGYFDLTNVSPYSANFSYVAFFFVVGITFYFTKLKRWIDPRRFFFGVGIWFLFMVLWGIANFHVTLFNGMTQFYSDLDVNLVENVSWLIFAGFFVACFKRVRYAKL